MDYSTLRLAVPVLLLALGSCTTEATSETVEFLDGRFSVTKPADWRLIPGLNEEADLEMGNPRTEAYGMVLSEPKGDFAEDLTLAEYSDMTRELMMESLENGSEEGPERMTVNGEPALRYVLNGTIDRIRVKYWHVSIDSGDHFHQVLLWSLPSRFDEHVADFEAVLNSFSDVSAAE
ncbi:MAG: hypothetical protein KY459_04065 [Acidobacteria bacterium]|nr:hypothetical protein [Acidobacteriota bacterium]